MAASVIHATLARNNITNNNFLLSATSRNNIWREQQLSTYKHSGIVPSTFSCSFIYGTRLSTSQNFYRKKSNLEIKKNSFSRLGVKLWNEIPTKLRTLSKHKFKFNICASLLDILETGITCYETDEIILKMKKAEPTIL